MTSIEIKAPAKVNLFLKVLGKRGDGYHEISTLMQAVSVYDHLRIEVSSHGNGSTAIVMDCDSDDVPKDDCNIAHRAAALLLNAVGIGRSVRISIAKRIPVGAGLGGGSSDAAAVLTGLNKILGHPLSEQDLVILASRLGSDVPFFIRGGAAFATGRGEILREAFVPELDYVLVNPGFHVSTAWVYSNLSLTNNVEDNNLTYSRKPPAGPMEAAGLLVNDLESVTLARHPELISIKGALKAHGALNALMSGSGPTVFGLFADALGALNASDALRQEYGHKKGYSVHLAKGMQPVAWP